ncbi:MAG: hypothetical protein GVY36_17245 [Verrucomicrobia bacterium]|jgi:hypothetical protein|nr:hypothetical protein [Verrucomicrobiota bacterium]
MESLGIIIIAISIFTMLPSAIVDIKVSGFLKKKYGKHTSKGILIRSLSHGFLLVPTLVPLGLVGFVGPVILGFFTAPNERIMKWNFFIFGSVFLGSLVILYAIKFLSNTGDADLENSECKKAEPVASGQRR